MSGVNGQPPKKKRTSSQEVRQDVEQIRLNRFLAQLGVGSRRACDDLIRAGKVMVDGRRVKAPGVVVSPDRVRVSVDGVSIDRPTHPIVLILHKPTGVVSTVSDPDGRPTVVSLCGKYARNRRLFPVGRLDVNTTGALLITNDGLLCYRLTHPKFQVPRTYDVRVRGRFDEKSLGRLRRMAVPSRAQKTRTPAGVSVVKQIDKTTMLRVTLIEGRNRQVRRMCESIGLRVVKLKRISFGPVTIKKLPVGSVRPLERRELDRLRQMTETQE